MDDNKNEITVEDIAQLYKVALLGTPTQKSAAVQLLKTIKRISDKRNN